MSFYISLNAILFYISLIRMDTPGKSGNGIGWNAAGLVGDWQLGTQTKHRL